MTLIGELVTVFLHLNQVFLIQTLENVKAQLFAKWVMFDFLEVCKNFPKSHFKIVKQ